VNRKHAFAAVVIVVVAILLVLTSLEVLFTGERTNADGTYTQIVSSVHAAPFARATNGQIALKVNSISDASNPATRDVWMNLSSQARAAAGVYLIPLTPSVGETNFIANVTVTNVKHAPVSFSYGNFFVVGRDDHTYYASYAVCSSSCSANVLKNRTLSPGFTSDVEVLFRVAANVQPAELVYASEPPIVMALT
jgi:hypothetical protein